MDKKLINKLLVVASLNLFLIGGFLLNKTKADNFNPRANNPLDCADYFAESNNYSSIYEINQDLIAGTASGEYKTWGTVTNTFSNPGGNFNFYIQSTDQFHRTSGIHIYQSNRSDIQVGNIVTISGPVVFYNHLPEFVNPTIVVDQANNPYPVEPYITTSAFWRNGNDANSSEFKNAETMGSRQLQINQGLLTYISSGNATITLEDVIIPLYFSNITNTSLINNKVSSLDGQIVNVTGHLHCFISGTTKMQLLIRNPNEIIGTETVPSNLTLSSTNGFDVGSYSTGNYGNNYIDSYEYEYYRAIRSSGNLMTLLPNLGSTSDGSAPGAFYNISSLDEISSLKITYYTNLSSGASPTISFGTTPVNMVTSSLPLSSTATSQTFSSLAGAYFKVQTSEARLTIVKIELTTSQTGTTPSFSYSGTNNVRINPVTYQNALYEGAQISVPSQGYYDGINFIQTGEKIYTYYSYQYIAQYPALADLASYTDPSEIAAYYTAFKTWPANYVIKSNYFNAYNLFGNDARCVSTYDRTDGYATAIPYQIGGSGKPSYHELDVALETSYSSNNRGVGRVVCWQYGFDASGYDSNPVAVYTDDHYATFQEYLNTGVYGTRFNAEMNLTPFLWGANTTVNLISL